MAKLLDEDRKLGEARLAGGQELTKRPYVLQFSAQYSLQNLLHGLHFFVSTMAALQELTQLRKFTTKLCQVLRRSLPTL